MPNFSGKSCARDHGKHAVKLNRPRGIDAEHSRMGMGATQKLRINRAGKIEIIRKDRLAGAFGHRIDLAERLADHRELLLCHPITLVQNLP